MSSGLKFNVAQDEQHENIIKLDISSYLSLKSIGLLFKIELCFY